MVERRTTREESKRPRQIWWGRKPGKQRGFAKVRLEQIQYPSDEPGEKAVRGRNHVTKPFSQGGSSSTWEEANLDAPKQLTETLHEYGKADGAGEKAENKTSSLNEREGTY